MLKKILVVVLTVLVLLVALSFGAYSYFRSAALDRLAKTYRVQEVDLRVPYPLTETEQAALRKRLEKAEAKAPASDAVPQGEPAPSPGVAQAELEKEFQKAAQSRGLARGKRYLESRAGCRDCHGEDLGGKVIIENPAMGKWIAPNITRGGVTRNYRPSDWARLIRHGVKPSGLPALMPSQDFTWLSDQEVSDIVLYIQSLPAVDRVMPGSELGPIYSMLIATGRIPIAAETLDHTAARAKTPPALEPTIELGKHLATTCVGCHGPRLAGGPIVGGDPAWPAAANLTFHETGLLGWELSDFRRSLREGKSRDGRVLHPAMPISYTKNLNDAETEGLYLYLKTQAPLAFGSVK